MAAMLAFAVACGGAEKSNDEAVEQTNEVEVAAPVVEEAPVVEAAPVVEESAAVVEAEPKVELQAPAEVKADEKAEAKAEMKDSGLKVSNMTVVEKSEEPKKIEQAGTGAKRVK